MPKIVIPGVDPLIRPTEDREYMLGGPGEWEGPWLLSEIVDDQDPEDRGPLAEILTGMLPGARITLGGGAAARFTIWRLSAEDWETLPAIMEDQFNLP